MNVKYLSAFAVVLTLVCISCGAGSSSVSNSPPPPTSPNGKISIVSSFAGDTRTCSPTSTGCPIKPDPVIAVGPMRIVLYTRLGLTVINRNGSVAQATVDPQSFWAAAGIPGILASNVIEPHGAYDIFTHRYVITQGVGQQPGCGDLMAVSAADDPTQWKAINISGRCGDHNVTVGYDKNGIYTCEEDLTATPPGSVCAAIPAADTQWTGSGGIVTTHLVVAVTSTGGIGDGRFAPSININSSAGLSDPMVLVARPGVQIYPSGTPLLVNFRKWTWTDPNTPMLGAATSVSTGYTYYMNSFQTPPNSVTAQPNSPSVPYLSGWEGGRNIQPVIDLAGNVWFTLASDIGNENGNLGFYWFKVPVSSLTIAASGVVYDNVGSSAISYGTAAIDSNGNAYLFYEQGSTAEYWSHYVRVLPGGSSTMTAPVLLKAGGPNPITASSGQINTNTIRDGTFAAQSIDPTDLTKVWFYGQYANNPAPDVWVTWVSEVSFQ